MLQRHAIDDPGLVLEHQQALQFAAEAQLAVSKSPVQGLLPQAVAGQHQPASGCVPDGDREHAAQFLHAGRAVFLVEVDDGLGVAVRLERVALALEFLA